MLRTFNCGLGIILIVGSQEVEAILRELPSDYAASVVGRVEPRVEGMTFSFS